MSDMIVIFLVLVHYTIFNDDFVGTGGQTDMLASESVIPSVMTSPAEQSQSQSLMNDVIQQQALTRHVNIDPFAPGQVVPGITIPVQVPDLSSHIGLSQLVPQHTDHVIVGHDSSNQAASQSAHDSHVVLGLDPGNLVDVSQIHPEITDHVANVHSPTDVIGKGTSHSGHSTSDITGSGLSHTGHSVTHSDPSHTIITQTGNDHATQAHGRISDVLKDLNVILLEKSQEIQVQPGINLVGGSENPNQGLSLGMAQTGSATPSVSDHGHSLGHGHTDSHAHIETQAQTAQAQSHADTCSQRACDSSQNCLGLNEYCFYEPACAIQTCQKL